jgi:hypothetical protein
MSKIIEFQKIKDELVAVLNNNERVKKILLTEKITLVEGFVNEPFRRELSDSIVVSGPSVPMIMLLGESGQIYFFALKALLPHLEL